MGCMIWQGMFGNGVRIGMALITTITHQLRTRQGRTQAHTGCCGVVVGTTLLSTCGWLPASAAFRMLGAPTSGFDVCQDRINYPWPHEVRSLQATKERPLLTGQSATKMAWRLYLAVI